LKIVHPISLNKPKIISFKTNFDLEFYAEGRAWIKAVVLLNHVRGTPPFFMQTLRDWKKMLFP